MTVHVVGAGLAGLAASLRLVEAGVSVVLHEAAPAAGGRCRSFLDRELGAMIDNGNHLVLTGNAAVRGYLARIGASEALVAAAEAQFPFVDLADGARWTVAMGGGALPFWIADPARRPPGTTAGDFVRASRLALARPRDTVASIIRDRGPIWERFWLPLTLAVMNAPPERASARLLLGALLRSFARGGAHCRPMFAPAGLGAALVEPAVAFLSRRGAGLRFRHPLRAIRTEAGRVVALGFADGEEALGRDDRVILALPPARLVALLPELSPPAETGAILNAHFRMAPAAAEGAPPLLGVLSAHAQWVFRRGDILSVTVSGAEGSPLMTLPHDDALATLWAETRAALGLVAEPLGSRLLKEKRATFDQSPEGVARRLPMRTRYRNLLLAGDHVRTGLPATLEGAVHSGDRSASATLRAMREPSAPPPAANPAREEAL